MNEFISTPYFCFPRLSSRSWIFSCLKVKFLDFRLTLNDEIFFPLAVAITDYLRYKQWTKIIHHQIFG